MQSKLMRHAALALFGGLLAGQAQASIVLTFFPASDFNANTATMDATLGITGYTIDDFESKSLIPSLTIKMGGFGVPDTTLTSLSNLFDESVCGSLSNTSVWDGTHGVINIPNNQVSNCSSPSSITKMIEFDYAGGITSFGIGMGNFQSSGGPVGITNHELFVNGVDEGVLETLAGAKWTPGLARNAYLRVDATGGDKITSVGFENLSAADVLVFDHLAVKPLAAVPEPGFAWPLLAAAAAIFLRRYSTESRHRT